MGQVASIVRSSQLAVVEIRETRTAREHREIPRGLHHRIQILHSAGKPFNEPTLIRTIRMIRG